jgi:hypothetical protein
MLDAAEFAREFLSWWEDPPGETGGRWTPTGSRSLATPMRRGVRPVWFGVAVAPDRSWSRGRGGVAPPGRGCARVSRRPTVRTHHGWGTGSRVAPPWGGTVVADSRARDLIADAREPGEQDQALAEAALSDAVTAGTLTHGNEPELFTAVGSAVWQQAGAHRRLVSSGTIDITRCGLRRWRCTPRRRRTRWQQVW